MTGMRDESVKRLLRGDVEKAEAALAGGLMVPVAEGDPIVAAPALVRVREEAVALAAEEPKRAELAECPLASAAESGSSLLTTFPASDTHAVLARR